MKLIAIEEARLLSVLDILEPMILKQRQAGDLDSAHKLVVLKDYLRTRLETAPEVATASSMGKKGGLSRSHRKLQAARENARKAGPPGNYYACLVISPATTARPRQAIYYWFADKESRDEWVGRGIGRMNEPGNREPLLAIDNVFSAVKRKDPAALAAGNKFLAAELERERLTYQYERYQDTIEECDGCGDLVERKTIRGINVNQLCESCVMAIR